MHDRLRAAAPLLVAALTAAAIGAVWGSLDQVPVVHDEAAYLLQAEIFASGRWTAPARPLPEFFEQFHVFSTPVVAARYFPGHALLLVPGVWLGLPGLVPLLANALAGMLLFVLARRVANAWVALLAWGLWVSSTGVARFHPSYLSQVTTTALWLASWWALLRWRETDRARDLALLSLCLGWGAITRPLSMLLCALPVAAVVVPRLLRRPAPRRLAAAALPGLAALALLPVWGQETLGDWRTMPYTRYVRMYFPFDKPGFHVDETPPERELPPDFRAVAEEFLKDNRRHTVPHLPRILAERLLFIARDMWWPWWSPWRVALLPFVLVGLLALRRESAFAAASAALLILGHLIYSHAAFFSAYYMEAQPVLAFLTALGLWHALAVLARGPRRGAHAAARRTSEADARPDPPTPAAGRRAAAASAAVVPDRRLALALLAGLAILLAVDMADAVQRKRAHYRYHRSFRALVEALPDTKAVVFVRYAPGHDPYYSLIRNPADLHRARVWVVRDRGPDDERLLRLARGRRPYLYDERAGRMTPLPH